MKFERITHNDLKKIKHLQPEGWSDITVEFKFYVNSPFCYPIQTKINNKVVGIGALIEFRNTAWLAHIIVDTNHRRKGIGCQIVEELLKCFDDRSIDTFLLVATQLGKSIYKKVGFRLITEYIFFKKAESLQAMPISSNVIRYKVEYQDMIYQMDRDVSGENRADLLKDYLNNSYVYLDNDRILGYYLPNLREGLIIADNENAGRELLKLKLPTHDKIVLPSDNLAGIEFLKQNRFVETDAKGTRMILGKNIDWQPKKIFSRIGGNFG